MSISTVLFLAAASSAAAAQPLTVDPSSSDPSNKFWGIGGLSGGGATTRLLVDYPEPQRSEVLDILFKPNYAASLQVLKVEIGGDSQSTDGTESSHMHSPDDLNFERGYEWWLMKEAKARNPDIKLYGLAWAFPGWVGNFSGDPFSHPDLTSKYISSWVTGAKEVYNLTIDYVGIWNERSSDATYVKYLKKVLKQDGHGNTLIVAKDGNDQICDDMTKDPEYAAAVDIIGLHYPSDFKDYSTCLALNKPFWASEESSSYDDLNGAACWARVVTSHWVLSKMTSSIMWNLVGSYFHGTNWYASSMLTAVQPWTGFYGDDIDGSLPVVWATAHVTQFTDFGWHYLQNGSGSGVLPQGGYYASLVSPDGTELTMTIAKISREHAPCTRPKLPEFDTADEYVSFQIPAGVTAPEKLHFYYSNYETEVPVTFEPQPDVVVTDGKFGVHVPVGSFITLSTRTGTKGTIPAATKSNPIFPLPYKDDFQSYVDSQEAHYFSDQIGAFEVHPETPGSKNWVMQQMVPALPIGWGDPGTFGPMTLIGMREHQDVTVSVSFKLPADVPSIAAGCVGTRADQMWHEAIAFCVEASGAWNLALGGPKLGTNTYQKVYASGTTSAAAGSWHKISLTTVGGTAQGVFDGKSLFSGVAIRDIDTGFAVIGGSHWVAMQYDDFSLEKAGGSSLHELPRSSTANAAIVGTKICSMNCSRNGLQDPTMAFDLTSNWLIKHKDSGLCVSTDESGSLSLATCAFHDPQQEFLNDYTRIRNTLGAFTTKMNSTLMGGLDGTAMVGEPSNAGPAQWHMWSYFPNTKQLRNQYTGLPLLGYPKCLSTC